MIIGELALTDIDSLWNYKIKYYIEAGLDKKTKGIGQSPETDQLQLGKKMIDFSIYDSGPIKYSSIDE